MFEIDHPRKFTFAKFFKTGHRRSLYSRKFFEARHPRKFLFVKHKNFVVLPDRKMLPSIFFSFLVKYIGFLVFAEGVSHCKDMGFLGLGIGIGILVNSK